MDSINDSSENKMNSGTITEIDPPANEERTTRDPVTLILQTLFFAISVIPLVIYSFIADFLLRQPKSVKGKVVLVTGSGRGFGRGIAEKFVQLGSRVACVDIDEKLNEKTVKDINDKYPGQAIAYKCNVAEMEDIEKLHAAVKKDFGHVDILIHNAGLIFCSSLVEQEKDFIDKVIAVNLTSHFYMIRKFLPDMIERNQGHIVAVSSVAAFGCSANSSLYVATKSGVLGLMNCLNEELRDIPNNAIKTSTVCPWFINTSAHYTKQWNLRFRIMSIEEAVEACVDGIRKEKRLISIPHFVCTLASVLRLFPDSVLNLAKSIYPVRLNPPPKQVTQNIPVFKLLSKDAHNLKSTISTN